MDDDFFDLGGDSLSTARVAAGLNIDIAELVGSPTIRQLAHTLESQAQPAPRDWMCWLRRTEGRPPLFCIPGHDGGLVGYRQLTRLLPADQPVVAFLPPPELAASQHYSLDDLAARYVEQVLRFQPGGSIILSGVCFGGCVAYEMACRLEALGRKVDTLLLLECFQARWLEAQPPAARMRARAELASRRAWFHLSSVARAGPRAGWAHLRARAARAAAAFVDARGQRRFDRLSGSGKPLPAGWAQAGFANRVAARAWNPKPYLGRVVLLGGAEPRKGQYDAPRMGWAGPLRGDVECVLLPDQLKGLLSPPAVHKVAERFVEEIKRILG